jgi:hypothetical protein
VKALCRRFCQIPLFIPFAALERIVKEGREECRVVNAREDITADDGIDRCAG